MLLRAEGLYRENAPSRAMVQNVFFRLWTGGGPTEFNGDPSTLLPDHGMSSLKLPNDRNTKEAVLFKEEDLVPWVVFTCVFIVLVVFDNAVLHRKAEKLSLLKSMLYTTFWIAVAAMFNVYVFWTRGLDDAFTWGTGYMLEWMLSVDNLFVFHRIFSVLKTPDDQKHKPLFYGIMGAIVFRMIFFLIEEMLLHHVAWMHLVFGVFLIYTGIMAVSMGDDDEEPDQGADEEHCNSRLPGVAGYVYQYFVDYIDYVDRYDDEGRFFIPAEADTPRVIHLEDGTESIIRQTSSEVRAKPLRATRLVLVVVCLEVTDLVFAVDSVSAIVAQIPDLFLAYTACVFAMLGLRAMFFAIDELVKMFSLLQYGVAFILIFLGVKLILRSWIHVPPLVVCAILITTLALSIFASVFADKFHGSDKNTKECIIAD